MRLDGAARLRLKACGSGGRGPSPASRGKDGPVSEHLLPFAYKDAVAEWLVFRPVRSVSCSDFRGVVATSGVANRDGTMSTRAVFLDPSHRKRVVLDVQERRCVLLRRALRCFLKQRSLRDALPPGRPWVRFPVARQRAEMNRFAVGHPSDVQTALVTAFFRQPTIPLNALAVAGSDAIELPAAAPESGPPQRHYRVILDLRAVLKNLSKMARRREQVAIRTSGIKTAAVDVWIDSRGRVTRIHWDAGQRPALGGARYTTSMVLRARPYATIQPPTPRDVAGPQYTRRLKYAPSG
jgi:hypothetical protein